MVFGLILAGAAACAVFAVRFFRRSRERRAEYLSAKRAAEERLPDRRNGYLRSRLQTALAETEDGDSPCDARLLQAGKLLCALKQKKLSGADGLLARKLQKEIGMYASKEKMSVYEREKLPTALTAVLTLCAKYEV